MLIRMECPPMVIRAEMVRGRTVRLCHIRLCNETTCIYMPVHRLIEEGFLRTIRFIEL